MQQNRSEERTYHVPVMLDECLEGLNIRPDGVYVDVTFGGGTEGEKVITGDIEADIGNIDLLKKLLWKSITESGVTQTNIIIVEEQESRVLSVVTSFLVAETRILGVVPGFSPLITINNILHQTDTGTHRTSLTEDVVKQLRSK